MTFEVNVDNLWSEMQHILYKLLSIAVIAPILGYGVLYTVENLEKAWKSGNKVKKWYTITLALVFIAIALGYLQ